MNSYPLVSVIIPVYNRENYLASAIESVFAQTYQPIEVIVVDDGSTDRGGAIAKAFPVQYFYQSNQGVSAARNMGIAAAKGEFIALLDSDDLWHPDKLSIQINEMLNFPEVKITATRILNYLEPETQSPAWFRPDIDLGERSLIVPSTLVIHRTVFQQIGTFSPAYQASEDTEWLVRVKQHNLTIKLLPEVLTQRRLHGQNLSWSLQPTHSLRLTQILKTSIAQKKQGLVQYVSETES